MVLRFPERRVEGDETEVRFPYGVNPSVTGYAISLCWKACRLITPMPSSTSAS